MQPEITMGVESVSYSARSSSSSSTARWFSSASCAGEWPSRVPQSGLARQVAVAGDADVRLEVAPQRLFAAVACQEVVRREVRQVVAVVEDQGRLDAAVRE